MADFNVVHVEDLGPEFDIGGETLGKITVKLAASLSKAADGTISVDIANLGIVSGDAGQILSVGSDGGALFDQAALQASETVWAGTVNAAAPFLTVTPGGTNGHEPVFNFDTANAAWIEAVQDAVGLAVLEGSGITYDDALNALNVALQNLTPGNGITITNGAVAVDPDYVTALATDTVCNAFGVPQYKVFPL